MSAKDTAKRFSLNATANRVDKLVREKETSQQINNLTTFEGVDPATGKTKVKTNRACGESAIAIGEIITTGSIGLGDAVLYRATEGDARIDKFQGNSYPTECGSAGQPRPRTFSSVNGNGAIARGETTEDELVCPVGVIVPDTVRTVGLAKVYERYTGNTGIENGELVCERETVTEPNSPEATAPNGNPLNVNDDGCVKPGQLETGTLKRCQWFDATADQALNYLSDFLPDGMFNSGYVEFPEGVYRVMGCMIEDKPATEEGIGKEWSPESATATGGAFDGASYCSGSYVAELTFPNGQTFSTQNPPISFVMSGAIATVSDAGGVIGSTDITGFDSVLRVESTTLASPSTNYCSGKPKAKLRWSSGNAETTDTPIGYTLTTNPSSIQVDWGGGDIDVLTGDSWTEGIVDDIRLVFPTKPECLWYYTESAGNYTISGYWGGCPGSNFRTVTGDFLRVEIYTENCAATGGCPDSAQMRLAYGLRLDGTWKILHNVSPAWALGNVVVTKNSDLPDNPRRYKYKVTSNTGQISERQTTTPPTVTLISVTYDLIVSDNTGQIASYEYTTEPTNFIVDCYDYSDAVYVCRSNTKVC